MSLKFSNRQAVWSRYYLQLTHNDLTSAGDALELVHPILFFLLSCETVSSYSENNRRGGYLRKNWFEKQIVLNFNSLNTKKKYYFK